MGTKTIDTKIGTRNYGSFHSKRQIDRDKLG